MSKIDGIFCTYEVKRLVTSDQVGKWCRLPYSGHKSGCPMYGRPRCPPGAGSIFDLLDGKDPIYLVYADFDLDRRAALMKLRFPEWSERQCRNVRHWQEIVRAQLRRNVRAAMEKLGCNEVTFCPEGLGVNVFATAAILGLKLEKIRRLHIDHHIALIGMKREGQ
jgi:hypothetical protein